VASATGRFDHHLPSPEGGISVPVASATGSVDHHLPSPEGVISMPVSSATGRFDHHSYTAGMTSNIGAHALRIGGHFDQADLLLRIPATGQSEHKQTR
jgi:hypothetical protein